MNDDFSPGPGTYCLTLDNDKHTSPINETNISSKLPNLPSPYKKGKVESKM